jgi:hypothetical protein
MIGIAPRFQPDLRFARATVNGEFGVVGYDGDGHPVSVVSFDLIGHRIAAVRVVSNPEKLQRVPHLPPGD